MIEPTRAICAICKMPTGNWAHPNHTDQQLAEHMRAELARRGYPDPWRQK